MIHIKLLISIIINTVRNRVKKKKKKKGEKMCSITMGCTAQLCSVQPVQQCRSAASRCEMSNLYSIILSPSFKVKNVSYHSTKGSYHSKKRVP